MRNECIAVFETFFPYLYNMLKMVWTNKIIPHQRQASKESSSYCLSYYYSYIFLGSLRRVNSSNSLYISHRLTPICHLENYSSIDCSFKDNDLINGISKTFCAKLASILDWKVKMSVHQWKLFSWINSQQSTYNKRIFFINRY